MPPSAGTPICTPQSHHDMTCEPARNCPVQVTDLALPLLLRVIWRHCWIRVEPPGKLRWVRVCGMVVYIKRSTDRRCYSC